jgi:predicted O-methyltransferase YrrM
VGEGLSETWILYSGERGGDWSINSKARPGFKLTVHQGVPFKVDEGDLWIASLPAMSVLSEISFVPTTLRIKSPDETYLTRWEAAFIEGLAASIPEYLEETVRVVEIGTGKGISLSRILIGLALHVEVQVWSIDLEDCVKAREHVANCQIPNWRYKMLIGDSVAIGKEWKDDYLDMIYFDGKHSYEGVLADVEVWYPHLKLGGILAFHDYGNRKHEVTRAVDDATKMHEVERVARVGYLMAFQRVGQK